MRKKIWFEDTVCDYPKCKNSVLNSGSIRTFSDCGHDICKNHIKRIPHNPFTIEKCGLCDLAKLKEPKEKK